MWIIGCDFHPGFQQIAYVDTTTGECGSMRLAHGNGEAEQFYRGLVGEQVRVGMEATGCFRWFQRLLTELGEELWVGDAARIRAAAAHKAKTDKRDAELLRQLLIEQRFPRVWVPSSEQRDARQLVLHRHRLVQMRTRIKNQVQALAMNEGLQRKHRLWSAEGRQELMQLELSPWGAQRRADLLGLLQQMNVHIEPLDEAVKLEGESRPEVQRLMSHPGVRPTFSSLKRTRVSRNYLTVPTSS